VVYYRENDEHFKEKARERRVEVAKLCEEGDEAALAQRDKARARKAARVVCDMCETEVAHGQLERHRASQFCITVLRKAIKTLETIVDQKPIYPEILEEWKEDLSRYEEIMEKNKEYEASRMDTCARCKKTYPHHERASHIASHQEADRMAKLLEPIASLN
jgi:hypothetical protein